MTHLRPKEKVLHEIIFNTLTISSLVYLQPLLSIARLPPYSHISDYMINELHWLPILARVRYKVLLLVAKSKQGLAPKYLCELMSKPPSSRSSRPLPSADRCDLLIPWSRTSLSQNRAFAVVGPALWNDSPPALRSVMLQGISSASLRCLKTFIFTSLSR